MAYPAALIMILVWASQHSSSSPAGPDFIGFDKIAHFFVFGLLATLVYRATHFPLSSPFKWMVAFAVVALYSSIDEAIQYFNPVRTADWMDLVADGLGAIVALFFYRNWKFYRELMERPVLRSRSSALA